MGSAGNVDLGLYTKDCLYADPTFSFRGRQKYERNLRTLTAFFIDPKIQLFSLEETDQAFKVLLPSPLIYVGSQK